MSPQQSIAHYKILSKLGEGGMGAVYRATDTKLNREVAVKILPDVFANDPDRLARFTREAQVLASLSHPNIAAIHGVEDRALIMELVDGPTLAERIAEGPIPLEEALSIARQIAEALEAAHEKGIVHRDLKPANIKVTPDGIVKVLDFGLAKSAERSSGPNPVNSPTLTLSATQAGIILGTAAYMSPEQATAKPVDKRADIWSFGVVLYEMLTGRQLFSGETVSHTLADVLRAPIDLDPLPKDTPPAIRSLITRCLERDVRKRLRDIGEARILLSNPLVPETARESPPIPVISRKSRIPWTAAALCALAALAAWIPRPSAPVAVSRTTIALPAGSDLTQPYFVAFSLDGARIAYTSPQQLYLRPINSFDAVPLPGTEEASAPFFSPDGQWIGFFAHGRLMKVSVHGGAPTLLCPSIGGPNSASWGSDGKIIFAPRGGVNGLMEVPDTGGSAKTVAVPDREKGENSYLWPEVLPGGKNVLFTIQTDSPTAPVQIVALNRSTGERKVLVESGAYAQYAASGHLVYMNGGTLMAAAFDPKSLRLDATRVAVLEGVRHSLNGEGWWRLSRTGSLLYAPGGLQTLTTQMIWVDMTGAVTPLPAPPRPYGQFSLSPDGRQVATSLPDEGGRMDLWTYEIPRNSFTRLTFRGINRFPIWTPDSKRLTYYQGGGVLSKAADGSGPEERLLEEGTALAWSPDNQWLLFSRHGTGFWFLPASGKPQAQRLPGSGSSETRPRFSPNGRWLAYWADDDSGRGKVFVRPFPGPGGKWQISTDGGLEPMWDPSGKALYYRSGNKMMRVEVTTEGSFRFGAPKLVFEVPVASPPTIPIGSAALSPDGKRFLMLQRVQSEQPVTQLNLVQNWTAELSRKTPGAR